MLLALVGHATTPDKIKLVTSAAGDVDTFATYMDCDDSSPPVPDPPGNESHNITTATTTDIVAGVADAAKRRTVQSLFIRNVSSSITNDVTVVVDDIDGNDYEIWKSSLAPGEQLTFVEGIGFFEASASPAVTQNWTNKSTASQALSTSEVYLTGSNVRLDALGTPVIGLMYDCSFDVVKSAGTGAMLVRVRVGTAGTTADTQQLLFTMDAGTSAADTAVFVVRAMFRAVGASAVLQGRVVMTNSGLSATGFRDASPTLGVMQVTSGAFDSGVANSIIGVTFNGQTAFAGTVQLVEAELVQR